MNSKRMAWDRPPGSLIPNRQGDPSPTPIYTALGRALSGWEGVNAALNNLHHALHQHLSEADQLATLADLDSKPKTDMRAAAVRQAGIAFLAGNFGPARDDAAKFKKQLTAVLGRYNNWAARRNELAHGYVTEAWCPDYSQEAQPIVQVYALLPSHARNALWHNAEPEWNYLAAEIEEMARQFGHLDDALEGLAERAGGLRHHRASTL